MANIPNYDFPTDPRGMTILMTNHDLQDYEQNIKQIRSMVLDNNMYINDLHDGDFAVFTTSNDQRSSEDLLDGYTPIPFQQVQNPQGIFRITPQGVITSSKPGVFDVSFCLQVTSEATKEVKASSLRIKLIEESTGTTVGVKTVTINRNTQTSYPAVTGTFSNVELGLHNGVDKRCSLHLECRDSTIDYALSVGNFDPYKNYLAIDPSGSQSSAGISIAKSLRNTLSGLSFKEGLEVRVTTRASDNRNVVYAESYNASTKTAS